MFPRVLEVVVPTSARALGKVAAELLLLRCSLAPQVPTLGTSVGFLLAFWVCGSSRGVERTHTFSAAVQARVQPHLQCSLH